MPDRAAASRSNRSESVREGTVPSGAVAFSRFYRVRYVLIEIGS